MARTHTIKSKANDQANATAILNGNGAEEKELKTAEKKADERFLGMSTATYVAAIENAAGFAKSALHLELAVGLSMFAQHGKADLAAKKDLAIIYQQAGYKCATPNDEDYKTVNRRINVAAEFFDWLGGKDHINEWTIATSEMQSIQAIVRHLEDEFNFRGMNSVLAHIGKPVILKRDRVKAEEKKAEQKQADQKPLTELPKEGAVPVMPMADELFSNLVNMEKNNTLPTGAVEALSAEKKRREDMGLAEAEKRMTAEAAEKIAQQPTAQKAEAGKQSRRKTDKEGTVNFATEHVQVIVDPDASREELTNVVMQLLEFINTLEVASEV